MADLELTTRYYWIQTPVEAPGDEHNYHYFDRAVSIPAEHTALVIVDAWDMHYLESHVKRTSEICRTKIAPAMAAARKAGVTIIHGPGDDVARRFPQWLRYAGDSEFVSTASVEPDWPPREFRRREGQYAVLTRPKSPAVEAARERYKKKMIDLAVVPQPEDFVIATGEQMHRLCRDREIMYLIYCGFATNMCVPNKPYGIKAFSRRGYHITLLRDATTAVEGHDTVDTEAGTKQAIRELEFDGVFSTTTDAFIRACRAASK